MALDGDSVEERNGRSARNGAKRERGLLEEQVYAGERVGERRRKKERKKDGEMDGLD